MRQVVITFHNCRSHGDNVMGREDHFIKRSRHRAQTATKSMNLGRMCRWSWFRTRWLCKGKRYTTERSFKTGKDIGVYIRVYHKGLI